jgi:MYXO-CTERM domain-containing protein
VRDEDVGQDVWRDDATDAADARQADVAAPADAGDDVTPLQGGCACGVVVTSPPRAVSLLALLLGVAARRRRRRGFHQGRGPRGQR